MKIYIPHLETYKSIYNLNDVATHSEFLNTIDIEIVPFLLSWLDKTEEISVQTSGSTGKPSQIRLNKSAMLRSAELTLLRFDLKKDELIVNCLPVKFIAGKMMLVRAMVGDLKIRIVKPSGNPLKNFPNIAIQFTALTPPQLESAIRDDNSVLDIIKTIIIGGAPVSSILQKELLKLESHCYATYGMTETITHIAVQSLNHPYEDTFKVLNSITLSTDEDALIISADHLIDSPISTNDIVELSKDRKGFKWLGRKDFVINSGGVKLFPESIEKKIEPHLANRFMIHKRVDDVYGEVPILIIESKSTLQLSLESLGLNKIETPKDIYYLDSFVETENGKLNRNKTAELIT